MSALAEVVADRLLAALVARGVTFSIEGDGFRFQAPPGAMAAEELDGLRRHKAQILALLTTAHTSDTGLPDLLRRHAFRQHPAGHRLTDDEQDACIRADMDAACDCGTPASHLTEHGAWQCPRCAGQGEPSLPMTEGERAYDGLRWELHRTRGAQGRARRAGDTAAADALAAHGDRLSQAYAAMRQKGL
jgi:hypothetical protein